MTQQVDGNSETTQIYTFVHSKLFHAKGFTPVLRDIKKKKKNSKNKEGNKDFYIIVL